MATATDTATHWAKYVDPDGAPGKIEGGTIDSVKSHLKRNKQRGGKTVAVSSIEAHEDYDDLSPDEQTLAKQMYAAAPTGNARFVANIPPSNGAEILPLPTTNYDPLEITDRFAGLNVGGSADSPTLASYFGAQGGQAPPMFKEPATSNQDAIPAATMDFSDRRFDRIPRPVRNSRRRDRQSQPVVHQSTDPDVLPLPSTM